MVPFLGDIADPSRLIPRLDYGLPAPRELLRVLYDVTFLLHIVFMNFVLIAPLVMFANELAAAATGRPLPTAVNRRLRAALPIAISFTITTGIGPLLLVQLLYGRFFYTSNILIGPYWLSLLGTLLTLFYLTYLAEWARKRPRLRVLVWLMTALVFAGVVSIGYIHTNNSLLSMSPNHWEDFRTGRLTLHVVDRMTLPRWAHNLNGAAVVTGLWIVWFGLLTRPAEGEDGPAVKRGMMRFGLSLIAAAAVMQLGGDAWYLKTIPTGDGAHVPDIRGMLTSLDFGGWRTALWFAGWPALSLAGAGAAWLAFRGRATVRAVVLLTVLVAVARIGSVVGRSLMREAALTPYMRPEADMVEQTQWSPLALFAVTLAGGVVTIVWMLRLLWRARDGAEAAPAGSELHSQPPG